MFLEYHWSWTVTESFISACCQVAWDQISRSWFWSKSQHNWTYCEQKCNFSGVLSELHETTVVVGISTHKDNTWINSTYHSSCLPFSNTKQMQSMQDIPSTHRDRKQEQYTARWHSALESEASPHKSHNIFSNAPCVKWTNARCNKNKTIKYCIKIPLILPIARVKALWWQWEKLKPTLGGQTPSSSHTHTESTLPEVWTWAICMAAPHPNQ